MVHILNSFIPIVLTVFGLYIAHQQYKLNKQIALLNSQRVKWDLFEKRYKVYQLTKEILLDITQENKIDTIKLRDYNFNIREMVFLFDNDINDYIQLIIKNGIDITHSEDKMKREVNQTTPEKWMEMCEENSKLTRFFSFEYQENIENRFMKYLNFQTLT
jgi:hypothetical protein